MDGLKEDKFLGSDLFTWSDFKNCTNKLYKAIAPRPKVPPRMFKDSFTRL